MSFASLTDKENGLLKIKVELTFMMELSRTDFSFKEQYTMEMDPNL
jgi:hypothetical protein